MEAIRDFRPFLDGEFAYGLFNFLNAHTRMLPTQAKSATSGHAICSSKGFESNGAIPG
jgi:hypothetical protein